MSSLYYYSYQRWLWFHSWWRWGGASSFTSLQFGKTRTSFNRSSWFFRTSFIQVSIHFIQVLLLVGRQFIRHHVNWIWKGLNICLSQSWYFLASFIQVDFDCSWILESFSMCQKWPYKLNWINLSFTLTSWLLRKKLGIRLG
jgi:hypothetical protein